MTKVKNEMPLSLLDLEISDPSQQPIKNKLAMTQHHLQIKEKGIDLIALAEKPEKPNGTVKQIGELFIEMNSYVAGADP